jgi:hypothetical protein
MLMRYDLCVRLHAAARRKKRREKALALAAEKAAKNPVQMRAEEPSRSVQRCCFNCVLSRVHALLPNVAAALGQLRLISRLI